MEVANCDLIGGLSVFGIVVPLLREPNLGQHWFAKEFVGDLCAEQLGAKMVTKGCRWVCLGAHSSGVRRDGN